MRSPGVVISITAQQFPFCQTQWQSGHEEKTYCGCGVGFAGMLERARGVGGCLGRLFEDRADAGPALFFFLEFFRHA